MRHCSGNTLLHEKDAVSVAFHIGNNMCCPKNGLFVTDLTDEVSERYTLLWVKPRCRLVENKVDFPLPFGPSRA